ncbi:membrane protein [Gordonia phage Secretariat]|uniref:Membrane protein n=1 Tax=Gordonia phage Secretariat TaxID=2725616 RepID=A0A6M3SWT6_9CAUD|nr:membrane protein [Gordonia phage Secretariat]QJD49620.1 membrane protein [Gordonia phage Secretariat]
MAEFIAPAIIAIVLIVMYLVAPKIAGYKTK